VNQKTVMPEEMESFFDKRAATYEAHMAEHPEEKHWLSLLEAQFPKTTRPTRILDLGCGTGRELRYIRACQPNAHITCIDLSAAMLDELRRTYVDILEQLVLIKASYFDHDFSTAKYDHVIACVTMHHWLNASKATLYRRVYDSLNDGGSFVLSDYYVQEDLEKKLNAKFFEMVESKQIQKDHLYHVDVPVSVKTETGILRESGFKKVNVIEESYAPDFSAAMIVSFR
jgi:tRNA (cmo5U34)-methyltransferase